MPQKSYTLGNLLQDCLDCDIRKSDIRQFFDDLKKKAHFAYAILCGAPKSVFWITLDDEESHPDEKTFSVAEFNDNYENFDSRIDSFRVNFNAYFFREQWATKFPEWELMENPFNGEERFCATSRQGADGRNFRNGISAFVGLPVPSGGSGKRALRTDARND